MKCQTSIHSSSLLTSTKPIKIVSAQLIHEQKKNVDAHLISKPANATFVDTVTVTTTVANTSDTVSTVVDTAPKMDTSIVAGIVADAAANVADNGNADTTSSSHCSKCDHDSSSFGPTCWTGDCVTPAAHWLDQTQRLAPQEQRM